MPDLLVNLLKLPPIEESQEFNVRRAQPFELSRVRDFVAKNFSTSWADEILVGFAIIIPITSPGFTSLY